MKRQLLIIWLSVAGAIAGVASLPACAADTAPLEERCLPPKCDPPKAVNPPKAAEPVRPGFTDNMPRAVAPGTKDEMPKPMAPGTADNPIIGPDKRTLDMAK